MHARYSGTWALSRELSDPASQALETDVRAARRDNLGARPESTSRAIRPTFRRAGEANASVSGRMSRTGMRQVILIAGARPERVELRMTGAGLEVRLDDNDAWMLPADGAWVDVQEQLGLVRVRLTWEGGLAIIERDVDAGGVVREVLEAAPNGGTLWLTRQVLSGGTDAWQPAQFTYGRAH